MEKVPGMVGVGIQKIEEIVKNGINPYVTRSSNVVIGAISQILSVGGSVGVFLGGFAKLYPSKSLRYSTE